MPEQESQKPEDGQPAPRRRVFGPTILRPPSRPDAAPADATPQRPLPHPSQIDPAAVPPSPGTSQGGHDEPGAPITTPTTVRGVERKRLPVTIEELQALAAGASPEVVSRAQRLVQGYVPDDARSSAVVLWGNRVQQAYADLITASLRRAESDVLTRVTAHLNRMMEILRSIDIVAVAGAAREGGVGTYFRKIFSKKIETPEELRAASVEIDQLLKLMRSALDDLLRLKGEIEESSREIDAVGDDVEAAALAAQFLSKYYERDAEAADDELPDAERRELSRRFLDRSMSLTQTVLQIRGSSTAREAQVEQPLQLISAIQDVALVLVPGWLGSIASLTAVSGSAPTPTESSEMAYQLRTILERMQR
ncbi:MAG: hypothetical protein IVW36_01170 [Dehalococcoidia bacterium]|nr:hypothetical protein [Dehalococcoidia bacterium]